MRKIFIAIAASLLIAVGSAVSLEQVNSKFLQSAMAQQDDAASPQVLAEQEEYEPNEDDFDEEEDDPIEDGFDEEDDEEEDEEEDEPTEFA